MQIWHCKNVKTGLFHKAVFCLTNSLKYASISTEILTNKKAYFYNNKTSLPKEDQKI